MSWREKTYEVLPALSVRGHHLRSCLRLVTVAWMWGVVWQTCISGDQMRAFCKILGFNNFAFGLMTALPFLATLGQLPAAIIVERTGLRKYLFLNSQLVARFLWMVLAAVGLPLVIWPSADGSAAGVVLALVIIAVSNFLAHLGTPPWLTWMGDLIPRRIRGRYFGNRAQITTVVQIVAIIAISLIIRSEWVGGTNGHENAVDNHVLLATICVIFAAGSVFGMVDILLFRRVREVFPPRHEARPRPTFSFEVARPARKGPAGSVIYAWRVLRSVSNGILLDPLRDRIFRHYVCYGAVVTASMTCCGWYYWKFASETLGFGVLASNLVFMAIGPVAGMLSSPWWGKMIDRWGRRPTLIVCTVLMGLAVMPWLFVTRNMYCPQFAVDAVNWLAAMLGSLAGHDGWTWISTENRGAIVPFVLTSLGCIVGNSSGNAFGLATTGIVLGFSDGSGRSKYVAASSVLINIGGAVGAIVGGLVAQSFEATPLWIGGLVWNSYQFTFLMGMVLRLLALGWLWNMPDPGARKVRDMFRLWSVNIYNAVSSRLLEPLRLFGWGRSRTEHGSNGEGNRKRRDNGREA
ncbi:MAG: MFS transporter [Phycisphaerae bacterium]